MATTARSSGPARSISCKLVQSYDRNDLLLAIGPAGSGKTYTAIALAVRALKEKHVKRIILTRPAVEAGEKLGFLPGDMKEKLDPYLQPLYDALNDMIPPAKLQKYIEEGTVQIAPLAYMRGRTLDNAFVILDEAQNTTLPQIKMFLTRMGRNAKFIVTGDVTQIDLPPSFRQRIDAGDGDSARCRGDRHRGVRPPRHRAASARQADRRGFRPQRCRRSGTCSGNWKIETITN